MRHCDVIIIGGGISGLGVALASVRAGLKTVLFEKDVIHAATSANSLRIIHGGFRYLQTLSIPRVLESMRAAALVRKEFPECVRPLPCIMPLKAVGLRSAWPVRAATLIFRALAASARVEVQMPRVLAPSEVSNLAPEMQDAASHGALLWYDDVIVSPDILGEAIAQRARDAGASIEQHSAVERVETGSPVRVTLGSGEVLTAKWVVNTAGPALGAVQVNKRPVLDTVRPEWCRGVNVVLRGKPGATACAGYSATGRLLFLVPRSNESAALGTMYLKPESEYGIQGAAVREFVAEARALFPHHAIDWNGSIQVEAGLLPCRWRGNSPQLFGGELVSSVSGYTEVLSTKYTTFMTQAARVLREIRSAR